MFKLRPFLILATLFALLGFAKPASAANAVYINQAGAGAQDGLACASAKPVSYFNTGANWSATPSGIQIGPDTTVHLCGTITTTPIFQGSGTSGHVIIMLFETGAKISQPFAGGNGLLSLNGKAFIQIDGGVACGVDANLAIISEATCNGIIEANANGTNLANHQGTNPGIEAANTDNVEIKNLDLRNIYVRVKGGDENPGDSLPAGVRMPNATNMHIHDIKGHDADWFFWSVQCSGSTSNIEIDHVDVYNINHGLAVGVCANAASTISFHDSHVGAMVNWDDTVGNGYHHDGVHLYVVQVGGTVTGVSIYNNLFDGDWGTFTSAHIFMEGSISALIYNNLFIPVAGQHMSNGSIYNINSNGSDVKNIRLYNNTFIYTGDDTNGSLIELGGTVDVQNNALVLMQASNGVLGYSAGATGTWNFNGYASVTPGGQIFSLSGGGPNTTYTVWKNAGRDTNSIAIQTPSMGLNTSTGTPTVGSVLQGAGTNLTSLGITALNHDRTGALRQTTGSWDLGAFKISTVVTPQPIMTLSPSPLPFPNTQVGQVATDLTLTVSNTGNADLIMNPTFFSPSAPFSLAGGGSCSPNLHVPASTSCTIKVGFAPTAVQAYSQSVTVGGNASSTVTITGSGISGLLQFTPDPLVFPATAVGLTSAAITETVKNIGAASITLSNPTWFSITDPSDANDFHVVGGNCGPGVILATNVSCTVQVTFSPHLIFGALSAHLNIFAGATTGFVNMQGAGVSPAAPAITLTPSGTPQMAFANTIVGQTTAAQSVTVKNTGGADLVFAATPVTYGGTNASDFAPFGTNSCTPNKVLTANSVCLISASFSPGAAGARSGTITLNTNASGSNVIQMTGTGVTGVGILSRAPTSLGFPNTTKNVASLALTDTLSNTGTAPLTLGTPFASKSGGFPLDFVISGGSCHDGTVLNPGDQCTVFVTFTPTTNTAESTNYNFAANGGSNVNLPVSGLGTFPNATLAPTSLGFGSVVQGVGSTLTFTVGNNGNAALVLGSAPITSKTGTNPGDFVVTGGSCSALQNLNPGQTCTIIVTFTPSALGARSATLNIAANNPISGAMSGTGIAASVPQLSIALSPDTFPSTTVGVTSASRSYTVTNSGNTILTLLNPFFGFTGTEFTRLGGTCSNGLVMNPGDTCTITVTFTPSAAGSRTTTLTISSATAVITDVLTGTGVAATFTLSAALSPTIFADTTVGSISASKTVTVTVIGTGSVTFSTPFQTKTTGTPGDFIITGGTCSDGLVRAPAQTCTIILTFNPTTAAGVTETTILTVSTTAASSVAVTLQGKGVPVATQPAPTIKGILLAKSFAGVTVTGSDFVNGKTDVYLNGTPMQAVCTATVCTATLPASLVFLPLLGQTLLIDVH